MAIETINNGETGLVVRGKINDNFTELNTDKVSKVGSDDIEIDDENKGIILTLGANRYRINLVSDGGVVVLRVSDPL